MILPRLDKPRYREFGTTTFANEISLSISLPGVIAASC